MRSGSAASRSWASSPRAPSWRPATSASTPWDELGDNQQAFACRLQEAFAAFLDHTDAQIGRFADYLETIGELDNTIFVVTSDNGASQEGGAEGVMNEFQWFNGFPEDVDHIVAERLDDIGGPHSHTNYPWGWAQAGNTPLKWYKQNTFGGGVRDPLVVHWPDGIGDRGGVRHQFCHVIDLAPTLFEVLGIEAPEVRRGVDQLPVAGTSLAYTWTAPDEPTRKTVQYFEQMGHRGIWHDGLEGGHLPLEGHALRRGHLGALPPGRGLLGVPEPGREPPREAARS